MPGQLLTQANPPPDPSRLSDDILKYAVQLNTANVLSDNEHKSVQLFTRAANYITAGTQPEPFFQLPIQCPFSHDILE